VKELFAAKFGCYRGVCFEIRLNGRKLNILKFEVRPERVEKPNTLLDAAIHRFVIHHVHFDGAPRREIAQ
jgi:hypothetical protein